MSQVEVGIRSLLGRPLVYSTFQWFMGATREWPIFVKDYVRPSVGDHILDIGCGTSEVLGYLPAGVSYFGFDKSESYIESSRLKYNVRGVFECALVDDLTVEKLPKMDVVLAIGLIHHLEDAEVTKLLETAKNALAENGRFIAVDPCYVDKQNPIAKWLIDRDRGNNVRDQESYREFANAIFDKVESTIVHRKWVPYTHHYLVCSL